MILSWEIQNNEDENEDENKDKIVCKVFVFVIVFVSILQNVISILSANCVKKHRNSNKM